MPGENGARGHRRAHRGDDLGDRGAADNVLDPVCGMTVEPLATPHRHSYGGHSYYFCSAACRTKFAAEPAKYLGTRIANASPAEVPDGSIYTCPMHPEVRQS